MNTCGRFFGYDVYIDAFFSSQWMHSKEFPHDALDPVSDDGVSDFACYGNPDAGMPDAVRLVCHNKVSIGNTFAVAGKRDEFVALAKFVGPAETMPDNVLHAW